MRHGWHLLSNRRTLWLMIRDTMSGTYRMSWLTIAIAVFSIAYIADPFDLIPDYIPVLGWIDDAAMFYLLLWRLVIETKRYTRFKAMERRGS